MCCQKSENTLQNTDECINNNSCFQYITVVVLCMVVNLMAEICTYSLLGWDEALVGISRYRGGLFNVMSHYLSDTVTP